MSDKYELLHRAPGPLRDCVCRTREGLLQYIYFIDEVNFTGRCSEGNATRTAPVAPRDTGTASRAATAGAT